MRRGMNSSSASYKIKKEIIANKSNITLLKNTLENSIKRINENTIKSSKNTNYFSSIPNILFGSLINFREKREILLDNSNNILDLKLIDTYPINLEIINGVFSPILTSHYYFTGTIEINNTTKKHKLFEFSLVDENTNEEVFKYKHTLIGGFNTFNMSKMFKLIANPSKTYKYSFRAKGDKLKLNNIDFNLFRINGTMA